MAIEIICQGCSRKLRVSDEHAGKKARCPSCGAINPIREGAAAAAASEAGSPESGSPVGSPAGFSLPSPVANPATQGAPASDPNPFSAHSVGLGPVPESRWLVRADNGHVYGPISRAELEEWVRQGRIAATYQIATEGAPNWQFATELFPQLSAGWTAPGANPWSAPPTVSPGNVGAFGGGYTTANATNPYAASTYGVAPSYRRPHRGLTVLILGILSWVICILFGPIAFFMGMSDVREMRAGRMDPSGMGMTQAGMYIGLAHFVITLGIIGIMMLVAILGEM